MALKVWSLHVRSDEMNAGLDLHIQIPKEHTVQLYSLPCRDDQSHRYTRPARRTFFYSDFFRDKKLEEHFLRNCYSNGLLKVKLYGEFDSAGN